MNQIIIDRKKYLIVLQKEYEALQKKAAMKIKPAKKLSLQAGKKHAYKLIEEWACVK